MAARKNILAYVQGELLSPPYKLVVDDLTESFKDGLALCALLHLADPSAFDWSQVLNESPLERCSRGLVGFEKKFQVPKLMDPDDIVSVPDDKGMTLYLSYCVDILQKKNPPKKTLAGTLRSAPDRRASAPNIGVQARGSLGGGGYLPGAGGPGGSLKGPTTVAKGSPSPNRKPEPAGAGGPPAWTKRKVPDMDAETAAVAAPITPPTIVIAPPVVAVTGANDDDRVRDMQKKLEAKDQEIEALKEAMRLLEQSLERKERELKEMEDRKNRELLALKALSGGGGGGGSGGGGVDNKQVKMAIDELKAQVDELEQHNQMLQMSLEDSRVSQRLLEEASKSPSKPSMLSPRMVSSRQQEEEEDLLRHQVRDAERRAKDAEKELEALKKSGGGGGGGGGPSARETRLQKQVGELEDKVVSLEQEARQLKRAADKVVRLEAELHEMEERESKAAQEVRDLKRQLRAAGADEQPATMERKKSNSKLIRSPREKTIPKFDQLK